MKWSTAVHSGTQLASVHPRQHHHSSTADVKVPRYLHVQLHFSFCSLHDRKRFSALVSSLFLTPGSGSARRGDARAVFLQRSHECLREESPVPAHRGDGGCCCTQSPQSRLQIPDSMRCICRCGCQSASRVSHVAAAIGCLMRWQVRRSVFHHRRRSRCTPKAALQALQKQERRLAFSITSPS